MEEKLIMGDSDSVTQKKCSNCHWWNGRSDPPRQSAGCTLTITDAAGPIHLTTQAWVKALNSIQNNVACMETKEDFYCIQWKEVEDGKT